ncbi:leucine/isoleucine/valine transporter subunit; ATP-binding component of ABC superfamily [Methylocella tundrae]|uniref:Leucine/isoleucine/valine transporter subunit ATP-binding component of ABC superfamily n=1 Tax=Methylocella tundrae TaxID=227605 RepID=A0A8B6M7N1_METTU|nr:ABC transporter ATP-binding protein [Methylocella tundrae]VTZ51053.1 leucine/isoleucine/valine transporter subunit; ATP-binding component of ABC superfamily [Methylocella tundrae]
MSAVLLDARGLEIGYGASVVVKGVDLAVGAGQIVCLIGANGAGKTTILRGVSGLLKIRAGSVTFDGETLTNRPAHVIARKKIAHVPEGRQIFAQMSVAENLLAGAYLERDAAEIERRREKALARFPRLKERLSQSAGLLSGGEQQMLAIARALMAGPKLLLLDEPSMGLAPLFVEEIFSIIKSLKDEGRTILLVEQNAHAALEIADHAYVLENGRIKLQGSGREMLEHDDISAAYLGG